MAALGGIPGIAPISTPSNQSLNIHSVFSPGCTTGLLQWDPSSSLADYEVCSYELTCTTAFHLLEYTLSLSTLTLTVSTTVVTDGGHTRDRDIFSKAKR